MIEPQDTVFFGSGTTVVNILRHVDPELEARVVTHSLAVAAEARGLSSRCCSSAASTGRSSTPSRAPGRWT